MKRMVVSSGLREDEIRPLSLLSRFKELSEEDALRRFGDAGELVDVACPACESAEREAAFEKNNFAYNKCLACDTVYVSPRPTAEALADYYANSPAIRYVDLGFRLARSVTIGP